ncbi:hypothetical protein GCM10011375_12140 [Hymenobacter qilianensis]|uniref:Uncharacterized protein n=2 Tax=Hymenobacter qilianensis TaxID=1385715 RepID=A0ACB5PP77_9BACT|nr:ScyD/ScyE family protein [Hymenobacter qilianensis]QNP53224.1 ScyD/ScyE family protein [Hymenobacter qilianensis]GGF58549.1 hypothetical protein GCM10011375_12140 [Hymenobacter qilianensis]
MNYKRYLLSATLLLTLVTGCSDRDGLDGLLASQRPILTDDLVNPIGMSVAPNGRVWVSETGTGRNDGRVSVVTGTGQVYPVFTGFQSELRPDGDVSSLGHVLYRDGILYILGGYFGKLYRVDVSSYRLGDPARPASSLPSEDIGAFVLSQNLSSPLESNIYSMTFGPDGSLYIVDAGANAIIRRDKDNGRLSVFARFPNITLQNQPVPTTQAVPTGIVHDGSRFLVSLLTGFSFAPGAAKIMQVSNTGVVSDYRTGFTTLTDIELTANKAPVVTQLAEFVFQPPTNVGFQPNTGAVRNESGTVLLGGLSRPTDIERISGSTYYVLTNGDGTIRRVTF